MIAMDDWRRHEEVWLLLPWLVNGRLSAAEREMAEEHIRQCKTCERELALQHQMCRAITKPDRVVYAPGPSFRKLMDRIDGNESKAPPRVAPRSSRLSLRSLTTRLSSVSLWRPPGIAWAASFLLLFGITGIMVTASRWAEPRFKTVTTDSVVTPNVLYIALDRSLPIGQVEELLRTGGARIVEGPGNTGVLGVMPVGIVPGQTPVTSANRQLRALAARLHADPRVLWVQPLRDEATPAEQGVPAAAGPRAPDVREH